MTLKNRLIIHFGTFKTGSTTLQHSLAASREELAANGILYPGTDRPPMATSPKHTSVRRAIIRGERPDGPEWSLIETERAAGNYHTVVLSCEGFSHWHKNYEPFFRTLAETYDITLVGFVRRQDQFAESQWAQRVTGKGYGRNILQFCDTRLFRHRSDYVGLLNNWAMIADVRVRSFDWARNVGLIACFAELADLPLFNEARSRNVTPGMNFVLYLHLLHKYKLPHTRGKVRKAFSEDRQKHVLGIEDRQKLLATYAGDNRVLHEQYAIEFDQEIPKFPTETMIAPSPDSLPAGYSIPAGPTIWIRTKRLIRKIRRSLSSA